MLLDHVLHVKTISRAGRKAADARDAQSWMTHYGMKNLSQKSGKVGIKKEKAWIDQIIISGRIQQFHERVAGKSVSCSALKCVFA